MIVLMATGLMAPVMAALLAAGAMIVLRVLTIEQAYRRISWTTVFLVAGMIPLSTAIRTSGAGEQVAELMVSVAGGSGPIVFIAALFLLTVTFGQLISNTATALVVIPIAVSAAAQLDISARPVLMCVCIASAAAFLTPVATPANMMVMDPAGTARGLLEARPADDRAVLRDRCGSRPRHLELLRFASVCSPLQSDYRHAH